METWGRTGRFLIFLTAEMRGTSRLSLCFRRAASWSRPPALGESIALAEAHAKESGYEPTLDGDFAADLEDIINSRRPRNVTTWE